MTAGPRRPRSPREIVGETAPLEPNPGARLVVHVIDEPGRAPVRIDRQVRIGRDAECEVRLDDESVSRIHAVIEPGEPPQVRDAGSRNGTFVAGERLVEGARAPLPRGTALRVGHALLLVDHERARREAVTAGGSELPLRVTHGPMAAVFEMADRLAADDITVLLTGETGVGKEVIAHYLHTRSPRAAAPFVPVHAAALTASLFESELFGYERGAFTGAAADRPGLFELADGGTLFFDEIGELPLEMQPKLLRLVEDRRVTRVGGRAARAIDVRIVAATNRDLAGEAARGTFRSDLYFRLSAFPLAIPPLRERRAEIADLARALVARAAAERGRPAPELTPDALRRLEGHAWPGNVRELKSVLTRALLLAPVGATRIAEDDLAKALQQPAIARPVAVAPFAATSDPTAAAAAANAAPGAGDERGRILAALARHAGNQAAAAAELGIARRTLLYKLDRLGIARPRKGRSRT